MLKGSRNILLLLAFIAIFVVGVVRLMQLRIAGGDVYPAYSSLRADPLGAKAFYQGLVGVPELSVARRMDGLESVYEMPAGTLLFLGTDLEDVFHQMTRGELDELNGFTARGGRLVIAFKPINERPFFMRVREGAQNRTNTPSGKRPERVDEDTFIRSKIPVSLKKEWDISYEINALPLDKERRIIPETAHRENDGELPESIVWRSGLQFSQTIGEWKTIYRRDDKPVIVERRMGAGSVVLCADSYLFSNQAMLLGRESRLLSWFIGRGRSVVFDEVHLGVAHSAGIANLVRRYRLHGTALALFALAALYIWRNATSLVPAAAERSGQRGEAVTGKDAESGLVNLLRRGVTRSKLLETCLAEWRKTRFTGRSEKSERARRLDEVIDILDRNRSKKSDPVQSYREICRALKDHKP